MKPLLSALFIFNISFISQVAFAKPLCEMSSEEFQSKLRLKQNQSQFRNSSGTMGIGVCWWHSRLQRSAIYLAQFDRPSDPIPVFPELMQLLEKIAQKKAVVTIPGYRNWNEFTNARQDEINFYLDRWQQTDSIQLEFMKGLKFNSGTSLVSLARIDREVNVLKRLPYVLVDLPYGSAHSWIITESNRDQKTLNLLDSNIQGDTIKYNYETNTYFNFYLTDPDHAPAWSRGTRTDTSIDPVETRFYHEKLLMSLHVQNTNDYSDYERAIYIHCKKETPFTRFERRIRAFENKKFLKGLVGGTLPDSEL